MSSELSKVELLAMIKQYNKNNSDKIKNIDKVKKEEIIQICHKYNIIPTNVDNDIKINLSNISKKHLLQDIELFFLKKGQTLPKEILQMKKNQLVEYMEENVISARRAKAELKQQAKGLRADGMGIYTSAIFAVNAAGEYKALSMPEDVDAAPGSMFVIVG